MAFEIFEHFREALPLLIAAIISLLTWRFWKFTLQPMLYHDAPKELPYWIPCKCFPSRWLSLRLTNITIVLGTQAHSHYTPKALT